MFAAPSSCCASLRELCIKHWVWGCLGDKHNHPNTHSSSIIKDSHVYSFHHPNNATACIDWGIFNMIQVDFHRCEVWFNVPSPSDFLIHTNDDNNNGIYFMGESVGDQWSVDGLCDVDISYLKMSEKWISHCNSRCLPHPHAGLSECKYYPPKLLKEWIALINAVTTWYQIPTSVIILCAGRPPIAHLCWTPNTLQRNENRDILVQHQPHNLTLGFHTRFQKSLMY